MRAFVLFFLLFATVFVMGQENLINTDTWTEGTGSVTGFTKYGPNSSSERENGLGPFGTNVLLWKAIPDLTANKNADGGWTGNYKGIDPSKAYRISVWVKKTNSDDGRLLLGMIVKDGGSVNSAQRLNGTTIGAPYFVNGDLPSLNEWYLAVGHIHESTFTGTTVESAVYDVSGNVVSGLIINDFKFAPTAQRIRERVFLNLNSTADDRMFFYGPTLYEVNAQMPSIAELLTPPPITGGDSPWGTVGNAISYTAGNVGIGTANPDASLAVRGNIHTQEVKVDLQGAVAPDYVFYEDYALLSLEEVQQYINRHGHLPNVPSAKTMQEEGVKLKEMNLKLLEKVEELTLYILQLKSKTDVLEVETKNLQKENNNIKMRLKKYSDSLNY